MCELGTLGCVGRVGWPQKIFNPPPQFSRLGIQVSIAIICLFVWAMVGWLHYLSFLSYFFKLVCYARVFPCIYSTCIDINIYHLSNIHLVVNAWLSGEY